MGSGQKVQEQEHKAGARSPGWVLAFQLSSPMTLAKTFQPTGVLFSHLSLRISLSSQPLKVLE